MTHPIVKFVIASATSAALAAACHSTPAQNERAASEGKTQEAKPIAELSVNDVKTLIESKSATVLDANDADTRKEYGVLPGAVLLASYKEYPISALPANKADKLVFYCGGTQCRASDAAATRAASAGYRDVNVMRAGIRGWKDAGQTTDQAPQS